MEIERQSAISQISMRTRQKQQKKLKFSPAN